VIHSLPTLKETDDAIAIDGKEQKENAMEAGVSASSAAETLLLRPTLQPSSHFLSLVIIWPDVLSNFNLLFEVSPFALFSSCS